MYKQEFTMIPSRSESPFKWPFPPKPKAAGPNARPRPRTRPAGRTVRGGATGLTRKAMLADIVLVIFWGASIPGLMWLGAAGGF